MDLAMRLLNSSPNKRALIVAHENITARARARVGSLIRVFACVLCVCVCARCAAFNRPCLRGG